MFGYRYTAVSNIDINCTSIHNRVKVSCELIIGNGELSKIISIGLNLREPNIINGKEYWDTRDKEWDIPIKRFS